MKRFWHMLFGHGPKYTTQHVVYSDYAAYLCTEVVCMGCGAVVYVGGN